MKLVQLSRPIQQAECPQTELAAFGVEIDGMFITDPFRSDCGRFEVNPTETYGLSLEEARWLVDLNSAIVAATEAAVDEGCRVAQERLGIETGDFAGMFYAGRSNRLGYSKAIADYIEAELRNAEVPFSE